MQQNTHYPPSIEEFYVGFQFEYKPWDIKNNCYVDKWVTKTFKSAGNLNRWEDKYLRDGVVRVKYLDRDDIESLGFRYNGTIEYTDYYEKENYKLELNFEENSFSLCIEERMEDGIRDRFLGDIKNKSELKKLLKQLNIEFNDDGTE